MTDEMKEMDTAASQEIMEYVFTKFGELNVHPEAAVACLVHAASIIMARAGMNGIDALVPEGKLSLRIEPVESVTETAVH